MLVAKGLEILSKSGVERIEAFLRGKIVYPLLTAHPFRRGSRDPQKSTRSEGAGRKPSAQSAASKERKRGRRRPLFPRRKACV